MRALDEESRSGPRRPSHQYDLADYADAGAMNRACADAHACAVPDLAWVSTLLVGLEGRRLGVGRRLLGTVTSLQPASLLEAGGHDITVRVMMPTG